MFGAFLRNVCDDFVAALSSFMTAAAYDEDDRRKEVRLLLVEYASEMEKIDRDERRLHSYGARKYAYAEQNKLSRAATDTLKENPFGHAISILIEEDVASARTVAVRILRDSGRMFDDQRRQKRSEYAPRLAAIAVRLQQDGMDALWTLSPCSEVDGELLRVAYDAYRDARLTSATDEVA